LSDIQINILLGDDFLDISWSNPDLWRVKRFQSELVLLRKVTCALSSVLLARWYLNLCFFGKSRVRYPVCCVRSWVPELVLLRKVVPLIPRLPLRCQRLVRSVQLRELVLGVGLVWMQLLIGMTIQFNSYQHGVCVGGGRLAPVVGKPLLPRMRQSGVDLRWRCAREDCQKTSVMLGFGRCDCSCVHLCTLPPLVLVTSPVVRA